MTAADLEKLAKALDRMARRHEKRARLDFSFRATKIGESIGLRQAAAYLRERKGKGKR